MWLSRAAVSRSSSTLRVSVPANRPCPMTGVTAGVFNPATASAGWARTIPTGLSLIRVGSARNARLFHTSIGRWKVKDYYETLGVGRDATAKDVKKAYYQLAKKYHPDTNKGDKDAQAKFQAVSEAYECLSDDSKRKQYDTFGSAGGAGPGAGGHPFGGAGGFTGGYDFKSSIDPEELFRTIFGDQFRSGGRSGFSDGFRETQFDFGAPQEYQMRLKFREAAKGIKKDLKVTIMDSCGTCQGSGSEPGTKPERCPHCQGTGMETVTTGPFMMRSTCRRCHGKGTHIKSPCRDCRGRGQTKQAQTVVVPVPAGVEDGQTVRMPVGRKEIFITFSVEKSDYFKRQGSDVHTEAKISLAQAVLGGTIRVQGIHEDMNVSIPSGTSSHTRMRMKGKGIAKSSGLGHGDHYIHVKIEVPQKVDDKSKALWQAYAELEPNTPGTVHGFTYDKGGKKVLMEDPDGLVADIREALEDDQPENGQDTNAS
ncbi:hypothetical protein TCAL_03631 [Tigriopus californicus]|uniref:Protein tumorous imaginal discs, mitochondrial n=1 Tax=Tigriopus californicus TaxID=6832 RepID=A0A553NCE0_TIGCA|nr:protein tumorous imaginal discs, mitochondrial-like [Tigriopus californicus]TRY63122.1 hypothetical protein TCAL_03631 [Tigriopus californicus]|eukprot:TCALIF_03631-PA protein Name:"Similar to l(2)tid Protein tumorous imaginal discs, mitochondrial (Drosophila virilis)" AED:0.01 eAED:0.01 QI:0/-1/0/1/-1/1/1/0/480